MKHSGMKILTLAVTCVLAMLACIGAMADGERRVVNGYCFPAYWRTSGNGTEISAFQVAVKNAPATIHFAQEEGLAYERSVTHFIDGPRGQEEEWGKYHIYYRLNGSSWRCVNWDKTRNGGSFDLYLNGTGVYIVWVVPYSAQEMTDSWTMDTFERWNLAPNWWIGWTRNVESYSGTATPMNADGRLDYNAPKLRLSDVPQ